MQELDEGGAISAFQSNIKCIGTAAFVSNRVQVYGGAIRISGYSNLFLSSGTFLFSENTSKYFGGALSVYGSTVQITSETVFVNNSAYTGAAIHLVGSLMNLSNVKLGKNFANLSGGAVSTSMGSHLVVINTQMDYNSAQLGGAIRSSYSTIHFIGYNCIKHNLAQQSGGIDASSRSSLKFDGTTHIANNTSEYGAGGLTVTLTNVSILGNLYFINNNARQGGAMQAIASGINSDQHTVISFEGNEATIQGGAVHSIDSKWNMSGYITFVNNSAAMGGAMSLTGSTKLTLNKFSEIFYKGNYAETKGGAIFSTDGSYLNQCNAPTMLYCVQNCTLRKCRQLSECFLELNADIPFDAFASNITVTFVDNMAGKSGSVIYGGNLDNCRLYLGIGSQNSCGKHIIGRAYSENALQVFLEISSINNMTSAVSSEPFRVCFCENSLPNCEKNVTVATVRGQQFTLSVVTVGQGNYTVPSAIKADFTNSTSAQISQLQRFQKTRNVCTDIIYRVYSGETHVTMILYPDGPCRDTGIARCEVNITFLPCPDGFEDVGSECACDKRLNPYHGVSCNVDNGTIKRVINNFWIMGLYDNFTYHGLLLHQSRCPIDFCKESAVEIQLENPDVQCDHNHSGVICGPCNENFSLALGSLHCLSCSNVYLFLILPFALAGFVLVALLLLLRLTVAAGTINGLIFYANIVQVNRDIFFPTGDSNILTVFIAWLNLDLGIETCLYDGMNAYTFIWLQFVFPFYLWFLIGLMTIVSRYSRTVARCLGSNPVSILATLFLLSYSKILQTVISILSRTSIQYPDGSYQHVWLYDGSVPYFQRTDHIVLGVFAILSLVFIFIPYTLLLLCGPWLLAYSHLKIFSWINNIKPFMDAYYAPYKKECRYWTGFLLLVRCALFLTFAFNTLGNSSINLLTIASVTVGLVSLAWLQKRLYDRFYSDLLEVSFILNLCVFAAATYHVKEIRGSQNVLAHTSVGIAFVIFICTLLYHVYRRIHKTSIWKDLLFCISQRVIRKKKTNENELHRQVHVLEQRESIKLPTVSTIEVNEPLLI